MIRSVATRLIPMTVAGLVVGAGLSGSLLRAQPAAPAQSPGGSTDGAPLPIAAQGDQVLVKREAVSLIAPEKYRVNLSLQPLQVVVLAAPYDGFVRQVPEKVNAKLKPQSEVVRLENTVQRLQLARAQAEFKLASLEQSAAKEEGPKAIAAARVEAAKASLDLAQYLHDQSTIRTPIAGEVRRIFVVEGQFVRAGEPLAEIGDAGKLKVEIPVERNTVTKGNPLSVKIETREVQGTVESVQPLRAEFDPLRDLFESITSAVVVFDNADGKLFPGQTAYVPLIPRNPVVQVASASVLNGSDGSRRVQVLRRGIVRDIPVTVMGPVGIERLYVSGPFAEADEVIYQSSHQLPDGFQLQPLANAATPAPGNQPATPRPAPGNTAF